MKIDPDKNVRLSSEPITFEINHLANEAHTEAFQDIFVAVITSSWDLFPSDGEIRLLSRHPFERTLSSLHTEQIGKKEYSTTLSAADFLRDLRETAILLYQSDNDTVDLFWTFKESLMHLVMVFDNPYFVMQD
jgi:hypothetical protein